MIESTEGIDALRDFIATRRNIGYLFQLTLRADNADHGALGRGIAFGFLCELKDGKPGNARRAVVCQQGIRLDGEVDLRVLGGAGLFAFDLSDPVPDAIDLPWATIGSIRPAPGDKEAMLGGWQITTPTRTYSFVGLAGNREQSTDEFNLVRAACCGDSNVSLPMYVTLDASAVWGAMQFVGLSWYALAAAGPKLNKPASKFKAEFPDCGDVVACYDRSALWGFDGFALTTRGIVIHDGASPSKPAFLPWVAIEKITSAVDGSSETVSIVARGSEHRTRIVRSSDADFRPTVASALSAFVALHRRLA